MICKIISRNLLSIRKKANLSRSYIEENYNIPATTIRAWETAQRSITTENLVKYLKIYQDFGIFCSIDKIVTNNNEPNVYTKEQVFSNFLQTSFGLTLLDNYINLFFYADKFEQILYANLKYINLNQSKKSDNLAIFKQKLQHGTEVTIPDNIYIADIIPMVDKNKYKELISNTLRGRTTKLKYTFMDQLNRIKPINIKISPNININNEVIGIVAFYTN